MSVKVSSWVWEHSPVGGSERLVLLAIADCAADDGTNAWPSVATLARKCRVDERTVQRIIRRLSGGGHLLVEASAGGRGSNRYAVVMTGPEEKPEEKPETEPEPAESQSGPSEPPADCHPRQSDTGGELPGRHDATAGVAQSCHPNVLEPSKKNSSTKSSSPRPKSGDPPRPDVEEVCRHLADRVEENGSKRPTVTAKWRDAARLLLDQDGRTVEQVLKAIDWCQDDEFWRANVLSLPKLRDKYDQLRLAAQRETRGVNGHKPSTTDQRVNAVLALKETLGADQQRSLTP